MPRTPAYRGLVATAVLLGGAWTTLPPADATETAVGFFMWGLDEAARAGAPAANRWTVEDGHGATSAFAIERVSACRYAVSIRKQLATGEMLRFDYALDFSAVSDYDAWVASSAGSAIIAKIEGTRWYSKRVVDLKSGRVLQTIEAGGVDANVVASGSVERLRAAHLDFRTNHCPPATTVGNPK